MAITPGAPSIAPRRVVANVAAKKKTIVRIVSSAITPMLTGGKRRIVSYCCVAWLTPSFRFSSTTRRTAVRRRKTRARTR